MLRKEIFTAGGQAVIEGVMMRAGNKLAIAVRKPNGRIKLKKEKIRFLSDKIKALKLPFVRGIANLFEILVIGFNALMYSADEAAEKEEEKLSLFHTVITFIFAIFFALVLFKYLPLLIAQFLSNVSEAVQKNYILFNFIDGTIKITFFLLYILIISVMSDVKRLFMYHGAEHKAVNCYEDTGNAVQSSKNLKGANKKLTVYNAKKYSTLHPRCGTSFIIIILIISIFFYSFIPKESSFWLKLLWRIILLPVIAGVSYELLKLSAKYKKNLFFKILIAPGLLVQRLTTREPDADQLEVSIKALESVLD